ncbi:MAG: hypothetical protein IJU40_04370 [Desulfovibrionaceae bacterium]|nr:hypothetical protein [Desulfovibrionaceae bacterium]
MSTEDFNNPFRNLHLSKLESESEKEESEKEKEASEQVCEADVSEDLSCSSPKEDLRVNQDRELFLQALESMASHPRTGTPLFYEELFTGYYSVRFKEYLAFIDLKKI